MKKYIVYSFAALILSTGLTSCGDSFLETDYHKGVDITTALNSTQAIQTALVGTYNDLFHYQFAGNFAIAIGDVPTDLTYWNTKNGHMDNLYTYSIDETDLYLSYIWEYGYKTVDASARIISAGTSLLSTDTENAKALHQYLAEAYALRAYSNLLLVNVFAHQVKVNGTDYSSQPGIVISDEPIAAFQQVSRSTVGQTYDKIVSDLKQSLDHFDKAGGDRGDKCYLTKAAVEGLLARTYLYMEDWANAKTYAQAALADGGISQLTYGGDAYKALYASTGSNTESFFYLDINNSQNWSANSLGTLWSSYGMTPSPKLLSLYASTDARRSIITWDKQSTNQIPIYGGGKLAAFAAGDPQQATNYLVNAPEMFLIEAEADIKLNKLADAQNELLVVAKRNSAITSTADLPQTLDGLYSFLKDERARELFQEGFRLWDLRRWGDPASVDAYGYPDIKFTFTNYNISNLVYPIPADEINAGFGVTQNDWSSTMPTSK